MKYICNLLTPDRRTGSQGARSRDFVLKRMPRHAVCAEIGVYKGDFSARILSIAKPRALHLIDPWKFEATDTYRDSLYGGDKGVDQARMDAIFESVHARFCDEMASERVCIHRASSAIASAIFPDQYFDWIYIDGNHLYEFVKGDLQMYWDKVKSGGYIAGDDYEEEGWWRGGVKRAVDEVIHSGGCTLVELKRGQFVLRKS